MRKTAGPARGWRAIKPLVSLWSSSARRAKQAGRPVDRPRAKLRHRVAQAVVYDRRGGGAGRDLRRFGGKWRGAALFLERRGRALPGRGLLGASAGQERRFPGKEHRGRKLRPAPQG